MDVTEKSTFTLAEREKLRGYWKRLGRRGLRDGFGSYENFLIWSMENGYADGMRLVRKDVEKPMGPDNAKWQYPDNIINEKLNSHPCEHCPRAHYCADICTLRIKWWDVQMEKIREVLSR